MTNDVNFDALTLRAATPDDVPLLRDWQTRPHVIAAIGSDEPWDWGAELRDADEHTEHLIAELNRRPIGYLQLIDPAQEHTHYWGDIEPHLRAIDIWIGEVTDLGHGLGTQMMQAALARCFAPPHVTAVVIDPLESNAPARRFYERLGFVQVGPRRFDDDACMVYRLERARWQAIQEQRTSTPNRSRHAHKE